jgi:hypothetical protein
MNDRENQEKFRLIAEELKKLGAAQAAADAEKRKAETINILVKIMSSAFDKMSAYISLIVIGGYAAFFSIWSAVEKFVTPWVRLWTFGFLGMSALLFVLSETYRITKFTTEMQSLLRALRDAPAQNISARHAELMRLHDAKNVKSASTQRILQALIVGLAVIGALILFWGIGQTLWKNAQ